MKFSIIIPTYNEAENIGQLVRYLIKNAHGSLADITVVDGGSADNTLEVAQKAGANAVLSPEKGRANQMNLGASLAKGDILYFVHADSTPPDTFLADIESALSSGFEIGCYRFKFRSTRFMLKVNAFFTRFDRIMCRGGDQTLFITRPLFESVGGFAKDWMIMEDYDLILKARKKARFRIMPKATLVSARKYEENSYLRVNWANFRVFRLYLSGASQEEMLSTYKRLIKHPKL